MAGIEQRGAAIGDHRAPGGHRRLDAEAEERERSLDGDDRRRAEGGDDADRRDDVGHDLAHHDVPPAGTQRPGRLAMVHLARGPDLGADDVAARDPLPYQEGDDDVAEARAHHRHAADGEEPTGNAQEHVDATRENDVGRPRRWPAGTARP